MRKSDPKKRLEELDAVLSALSHPSRRHVLLVVQFRGGTMTAGEIDERFQHTWPTTSRHLRVLERAGLLVHEKRGRTRIYRVNSQKLQVIREWLDWFSSSESDAGSSTPVKKSKKKSRPAK
ncbi:MAG TPA: metalloregulator ArsR/SmtB family transcription factor [Pyrinomonadaceae bacterium]|nr:metalloregulator ArsR/SmtB family transcription factor [Pyrinomonadaceae bacterium]